MAILWSKYVTYPRCRQCPACGCVFTFTGDQVLTEAGFENDGGRAVPVELRKVTRCQG